MQRRQTRIILKSSPSADWPADTQTSRPQSDCGGAHLPTSVPSKALRAIRRKRGVARRVLNVSVAKVSPERPGVVAVVRKLEARGVAKDASLSLAAQFPAEVRFVAATPRRPRSSAPGAAPPRRGAVGSRRPGPARQSGCAKGANESGPDIRRILLGVRRCARIAFWSFGPARACGSRNPWGAWRSRGPRRSGSALRPCRTLGTCCARRSRWTLFSFEAASERQTGEKRNCRRDTHANPP